MQVLLLQRFVQGTPRVVGHSCKYDRLERIIVWTREDNIKYCRLRREQLRNQRFYCRAILNRYKRLKSCAHCGTKGGKLHFHHQNQYLYGQVAHLVSWNYSWMRIKEEVAQCIVLCRRCHASVHSKTKTRDDKGQYTVDIDEWRGQ